MALPLKTTSDDIRKVVNYFKTKPTGATVDETKSALGKQAVDPRKMAAYRTWSILEKEGEKYKLSVRARDYARRPETERAFFQGIVDGNPAYRSVLEWAHHQGLDSVTTTDVVSHWHEHHRDIVGAGTKDSSLRDASVAFFHLCQAAGLGKLTLGRGGNPTRLDLDRSSLKGVIDAGPSMPPLAGLTDEEEPDAPPADSPPADEPPASHEPSPSPATPPQRLTAFIAHGRNMDIVDQVQTMLELADVGSEVAEEEETTAIPVPDKVFNAMKRCNAAIICVSAEESADGTEGGYSINENVLIEIGAAFVLYDRRVVLLWDKRLAVPSNLQGLYRCEYEGDELSWSAGMKLMKAIQGFKKPAGASGQG